MPRRCPLNSRCPLFRASVKGGSTVIVRASFRKCTSFLNSEYNFQFYWRVINVQQYRVRRNPRARFLVKKDVHLRNDARTIIYIYIDSAGIEQNR